MVRLKELENQSLQYAQEFQFLMVRLKVDISSFLSLKSQDVSIPYGSIKRLPGLQQPDELLLFQFLMVRLKVSYSTLPKRLSSVSIPYGSIKRGGVHQVRPG